MVDGAGNKRQLAILRHVRDREETSAAAVAQHVLGAPRTTFGRPLKLRQAQSELAELVAKGLLAQTSSGRRALFTLTDAGRQLIRATTTS